MHTYAEKTDKIASGKNFLQRKEMMPRPLDIANKKEQGASPVIQRKEGHVDISKHIPEARKLVVQKAVTDAEKMADRAQKTMGGTDHHLYKKWYDNKFNDDKSKNDQKTNERFDFVKKHWVKIYSIFKSRNIHFANTEKRHDDWYAYVYPKDNQYKIYLDTQFWLAKNKGGDSKGGTILHELAHEEAQTEDHVYKMEPAKNLATNSPALAVTNSDNWEYFAERQ